MTGEWPPIKLGSLGELRNGVNFSRSQEGRGLPILKVKDFGHLVTCPLENLDELDARVIAIPDDQMLADDELVGRSVIVSGLSRPTICPRFVAYALRSPQVRAQLSRFGSGTGIPNLNQRILSELELKIPPFDEQRAIAAALGALDDKIEQNRRTARVLERLSRAIFRAWFIDFEPVKAKAAGAASFPSMPQAVFDTLPTTFTDSELGPIPDGWVVKAVSDALDVNPKRPLRKGNIAPCLDMKNMPTQGHAPDEWIKRPFGSGMRFVNGDTLVARITPCLENGKTAFVDFLEDGEIGWGSTEYIVLRPKPPLPDVFAYCLARTTEFRDFAIQNMSGTSGRQRVNASALDHFAIAVPDQETARAFGTIVEPMFEWVRASHGESRKLAELRDYLLPKLLSGRLRVRQAEREAQEVA